MTINKGKQYIEEIITGKLTTRHKVHIMHCLEIQGSEVVDELQKVTSRGSRSGKAYYYKGQKIRASAPGEYPQLRSGKLNKSFDYKSNILELHIGNRARSASGAPYPLFLEEGTSKMNPRYYFRKTIDEKATELYSDLKRFMK